MVSQTQVKHHIIHQAKRNLVVDEESPSPPAESSLLAWFKLLNAGASLTLETGSKVSAWVDSVQGINAVQATDANRPIYSAANNSLSSDGIAQHLLATVAGGVMDTSDYTIAAWVKPNTLIALGAILDVGIGAAEQRYGLWVSNLLGTTSYVAGSAKNQGTPIANATWSFLTATFDTTANTYDLLVDKVSVGSGSQTSNIPTSLSRLGILGSGETTPAMFFKGEIGELYVYDRVLTSAEIALLHAYGVGDYS